MQLTNAPLNAEDIRNNSIQRKITARFMSALGLGEKRKAGENSLVGMFDALMSKTDSKPELEVPSPLLSLLEDVGQANIGFILDSLDVGIGQYRSIHGGDMPSPDLVLTALNAGKRIQMDLRAGDTGGIFDSLSLQSDEYKDQIKGFFDGLNADGHSHSAVVPTLAMVTISQVIANAMPIVAYLPNPRGSNTVPLVYVRQVAGISLGDTQAGDYLDGVNSSRQYFDNVRSFEMTEVSGKSRKEFTVKAVTVKGGAVALPTVLGANKIVVAGRTVASDALVSQQSGGATTGSFALIGKNANGFKLGTDVIKIDTGSIVNIGTSEFTVKFDKSIPSDVKVYLKCVANFEAKDATGKPILTTPNANNTTEFEYVHAYPIRGDYHATIDAVTQMQNELTLDPRASFVAVMINKLGFEQNIRLLKDAREIAIGIGEYREVDLSRGSDLTSAFNNTASIGAEIIPAVEDAKRRIIQNTNHTPDGFDIYVTGCLATVARSLADDTNFVPSQLPLGMVNSITRIGSRGTDNYYYIPESASVLASGKLEIVTGYDADADKNITEEVESGELLVVGRNGSAPKSQFVGHIAVPVVTEDIRERKYEQGVAVYTRQACQVNENERFGSQVALLRVIRLPKALSSELSQLAS